VFPDHWFQGRYLHNSKEQIQSNSDSTKLAFTFIIGHEKILRYFTETEPIYEFEFEYD
jgi:hypothetical protein